MSNYPGYIPRPNSTFGCGACDDPGNIAAFRSGEAIVLAVLDLYHGARFEPPFDFAMTVRKIESTRFVVVTGGQIDPGVRVHWVHDLPTVVNAVRMLIIHQPEFAWGRSDYFGKFIVTIVGRIPGRSGDVFTVGSALHETVRGDTADPLHCSARALERE